MRTPFRSYLFQGTRVKTGRNYFEGWYFKHAVGDRVVAFIPGISLGADLHRFIQVNDSVGGSDYVRFPLEKGRFDADRLDLRIGESRFSEEGIDVDLDCRLGRIRAEIAYEPLTRPPRSLWRPGIMGPFSYIPGMECYHALVSMEHRLRGYCEIVRGGQGERIGFEGGDGYIEKDWGVSFPRSWVWMQANSFGNGASFMLSYALIPWGRRSFSGYLGFFLHPALASRGTVFGTYAPFSRLGPMQVGRNEATVTAEGSLRLGSVDIQFGASFLQGSTLTAPFNGTMSVPIKESVSGTLRLKVRKGSRLLWEGESGCAGVEVHGPVSETLGIMENFAAPFSRR